MNRIYDFLLSGLINYDEIDDFINFINIGTKNVPEGVKRDEISLILKSVKKLNEMSTDIPQMIYSAEYAEVIIQFWLEKNSLELKGYFKDNQATFKSIRKYALTPNELMILYRNYYDFECYNNKKNKKIKISSMEKQEIISFHEVFERFLESINHSD